MKVRIVWGLALGILFLFMTLQSLPWVLFSFGFIHVVAQLEFAALRRTPLLVSLFHVTATTVAWLVISLCMVGVFPGELALVTLLLLMLLYAVIAVCSYEAGKKHKRFLYLLRAVLLITLPMSCIPVLVTTEARIPLYLLLIGASWGADSGAIFAGKLLGQRSLSPRLSPKKTLEGAIGGIVSAGVMWVAAALIYEYGFGLPPTSAGWVWLAVLFVAGAGVSLAGIFGDLVFSMYKRLEELKDYGRFIPGHGGILDRFDSMLFVAPVVYIFSLVLT